VIFLPGLSSKELSLIEDNLRHEQTMVQKLNFYASQANDQEVKSLCQNLSSLHQKHSDILMQHLNKAAPMQ
jgi:spore coat protein CotF